MDADSIKQIFDIMKGTNSAIYSILTNDETLMSKLAENPHFTALKGSTSRENSVIPSYQIRKDLNTPFLSVQEGSELFFGREVKEQTFFIRCYNSKQKTFVEINEILDLVRDLLDKKILVLDDRVSVQCRSEGRLPALEDQPFDLNYKEERYSVVVL
jgi:hypothetical protein